MILSPLRSTIEAWHSAAEPCRLFRQENAGASKGLREKTSDGSYRPLGETVGLLSTAKMLPFSSGS
jgi:hypothetical protein